MEGLPVQFNDLFAMHRFDSSVSNNLKGKLTSIDERAKKPEFPAVLHRAKYILMELALLQIYGELNTLAFGNYAFPIFSQGKPYGKLRLLVDQRKIKNLISEDYINDKQPVSTLADTA